MKITIQANDNKLFSDTISASTILIYFCFAIILRIDQNELLAARTFLENAAQQNIAEFLKALSEVLGNVSYSAVARTAAGLQLKNHLTSKDLAVTEQYQKRWLSFPEATREYIKNNVSYIRKCCYFHGFSLENQVFIRFENVLRNSLRNKQF